MKNSYYKLSVQVLISTAIILMSSCGIDIQEFIDKKISNQSEQPITQAQDTEVNFTKTYEGAIDGKYEIAMTLTKNADVLSGTYAYKSKGIPIKISGEIDQAGNLTIFEFNDKGSMTGLFNGQLNNQTIKGTWGKPDGSKSMPFMLIESSSTSSSSGSSRAICKEEEGVDEYSGDPVLTKTCLYKNFKTITVGSADYKGRYSYEYAAYVKRDNNNYIQIKNGSLFNQNKNELLSLINAQIKKDYNELSNDPCFEGESFYPFGFDQLGIDFSDNMINFHVTFGLPDACMSVDGTIVSLNLNEIQKYLSE